MKREDGMDWVPWVAFQTWIWAMSGWSRKRLILKAENWVTDLQEAKLLEP